MGHRLQILTFSCASAALLVVAPAIGFQTCGAVEGMTFLLPFFAAGLAGVAIAIAMRGRPDWAATLAVVFVFILVLLFGELLVVASVADTHYCP